MGTIRCRISVSLDAHLTYAEKSSEHDNLFGNFRVRLSKLGSLDGGGGGGSISRLPRVARGRCRRAQNFSESPDVAS